MSTEVTRTTARGRTAAFAWVTYGSGVTIVAGNVVTPLYPVYQRAFGLSTTMLTTAFTLYTLAVLVALVAIAPLSDRLGRRRILLGAVLVAIAGEALLAGATGAGGIAAGSLVTGLAVGTCTATAATALAELHPAGNQQRAALAASASATTGLTVGPLLAGLLAQYAPWPRVLVYLVVITLLLPLLAGLRRIPETAPAGPASRGTLARPGLPRARRPAYLVAVTAVFCAFGVGGVFAALIPLLVAERLGIDNRSLGGFLVALLFAMAAVAQLGFGRQPARRALCLGLGAIAGGLSLLAIAAGAVSLAALVVAAALAGLGLGATSMASLTVVNEVAPPERRASLTARYFTVAYLGTGVSVLGVGVASDRLGFGGGTLLFAVAIGGLAAALAAIAAPRALVASRDG